jgi:hypothetical protein
MQLTFDTTPAINSLNVDIPGDCSAPVRSQGSGQSAQNGRVKKVKPNHGGDTADYSKQKSLGAGFSRREVESIRGSWLPKKLSQSEG